MYTQHCTRYSLEVIKLLYLWLASVKSSVRKIPGAAASVVRTPLEPE